MYTSAVRIGCAVDDPELRERVERVCCALGLRCAEPRRVDSNALGTAAIVVELLSHGWDTCVAALRPGHPIVPHVVLVPPGRSAALVEMLLAPEAVRRAVHAVEWVDEGLDQRLAGLLLPLAECATRRNRIRVIQAGVTCGDALLADYVEAALEDPGRRTTVSGVIRVLGSPPRAVRRAIARCGFATPARFHRAVRVMGAHALLADGASVAAAALIMGYSSPDILREHFRRTVGVAPSEARRFSTEELAFRVSRAS